MNPDPDDPSVSLSGEIRMSDITSDPEILHTLAMAEPAILTYGDVIEQALRAGETGNSWHWTDAGLTIEQSAVVSDDLLAYWDRQNGPQGDEGEPGNE